MNNQRINNKLKIECIIASIPIFLKIVTIILAITAYILIMIFTAQLDVMLVGLLGILAYSSLILSPITIGLGIELFLWLAGLLAMKKSQGASTALWISSSLVNILEWICVTYVLIFAISNDDTGIYLIATIISGLLVILGIIHLIALIVSKILRK